MREKWKMSFLLATMPGPRKVKLKIWRFWGSWRPCQNQLIWFFWFIKPTWFLYFTKIAWYLQTLCSQSWLLSDYKREKQRTTSAFRPYQSLKMSEVLHGVLVLAFSVCCLLLLSVIRMFIFSKPPGRKMVIRLKPYG